MNNRFWVIMTLTILTIDKFSVFKVELTAKAIDGANVGR